MMSRKAFGREYLQPFLIAVFIACVFAPPAGAADGWVLAMPVIGWSTPRGGS